MPRKPEWRTFLIKLFRSFATMPGSNGTSPLFMHAVGTGSSIFIPCAGIPFPLVPNEEVECNKRKAREVLRANRRKSWTEVVPKTTWEGGFDEMDEIIEEAKGVGMECIVFDEGYTVGAMATPNSKGIDPGRHPFLGE